MTKNYTFVITLSLLFFCFHSSFAQTASFSDVAFLQPYATSTDYATLIAESIPTTVVATAGTPQKTSVSSYFNLPLQATVYDNDNVPLSGVSVTFSAPTTGASGTFGYGTSSASSVIVITDINGVATAPVFTSNAILGSFTLTAAANGIVTPAIFNLSNVVCISNVVTSDADDGPGSLRYIIANACPIPTITFAPNISSIALTSGEIVITQPVYITGPGANLLSISGSNLSRIFNIAAGTAATVSISNITIKDGKPQIGAANSTNGGGGVLITSGKVGIYNCTITNNDASLTDNGEGGGIDNEGGDIRIASCTIVNNIATKNGAGVMHRGIASYILFSTITNNVLKPYATGTSMGGGVSSYSNGLTLTGCTIYGNTAQYGGNLYNNGSTITTIRSNIIAGGKLFGTTSDGADIYGGFVSTDYNLIKDITGGNITGAITHNIYGVDPNLFPLGNYGGPTQTMLPMSNSPTIHKGDVLLTIGNDQRGYFIRVGGGGAIGSVAPNYVATIISGTSQSASPLTNFSIPLQTSVTDWGNIVAGDTVFYTAPATGASGTFSDNSITTKVVTNASGIATAPTFTANSIAGTFNVTASIGSTITPLNYILTNNAITPVTFGAVTATASNCTALMQWETLTESNSKNFTVEYSLDGVHFSVLATLQAAGNSSTKQEYKYTHAQLALGINYYRIKQVDFDGAFTYSSIVTVANACNQTTIVAYPNPIKNNLTVALAGNDKQTVTIFNTLGQKMTQYTMNGGTKQIDVSAWASGTYTLTVTKNGNVIFRTKVIK